MIVICWMNIKNNFGSLFNKKSQILCNLNENCYLRLNKNLKSFKVWKNCHNFLLFDFFVLIWRLRKEKLKILKEDLKILTIQTEIWRRL